jgi:hypothetical protein
MWRLLPSFSPAMRNVCETLHIQAAALSILQLGGYLAMKPATACTYASSSNHPIRGHHPPLRARPRIGQQQHVSSSVSSSMSAQQHCFACRPARGQDWSGSVRDWRAGLLSHVQSGCRGDE